MYDGEEEWRAGQALRSERKMSEQSRQDEQAGQSERARRAYELIRSGMSLGEVAAVIDEEFGPEEEDATDCADAAPLSNPEAVTPDALLAAVLGGPMPGSSESPGPPESSEPD